MLRPFVSLLCLVAWMGHPAAAAAACADTATQAAGVLHDAGFADAQIVRFAPPDRPDDAGLVATWPGRAHGDGALLLLANGGADGGMVAAMARLARTRPRRAVKLALTCDGAAWLAANRGDLIDAALAFDPAGETGAITAAGRTVAWSAAVAGKAVARFRLDTRNRGGRAAEPRPDHAIYQLAHALDRIETYAFPVEFTPVTRAWFRDAGTARGDALGRAMAALAADPTDRQALWQVDTDAFAHANIRTTCVATRIAGGSADDALPQAAQALLDCRLVPGHDAEEMRRRIEAVVGDPEVIVTLVTPPLPPVIPAPEPRPLPKLGGLPVIAAMANGTTDAALIAAGIPVLGVPGDPHALDDLIHAYAF
jgi:acetylornithine deacetylase/succinyl-diaminopimelate desuccinylase-like protein